MFATDGPPPSAPPREYLQRLADGTVKQLNPFTGTEVWTVPRRAGRPLGGAPPTPRPLDQWELTAGCAFCPDRYLETPPERARVVAGTQGYRTLRNVRAEDLSASIAEFRRVPNLFEILSLDYWRQNYGHLVPAAAGEHLRDYLSTEAGREHVQAVVCRRAGRPWGQLSDDERRRHTEDLFGGGHDLVIARRHFVDGATEHSQLAASGTLTPAEHLEYLRFTIEALRELYAANRFARYVAVYQNWLRPAGASFDHLHKQLVAIDERGVQAELELQRTRGNRNSYNELAVNLAIDHDLVVAENEDAVAFAGFGHRYPTLEIFSKSERPEPWLHPPRELAAVSDLIHAVHAATGADVPCNEEWHHMPPDADVPMPWRVLIKWRVSTLAGFEGGTKIYLNTIDPHSLRERMVVALRRLRAEGRIRETIRIGPECPRTPDSLRYAAGSR